MHFIPLHVILWFLKENDMERPTINISDFITKTGADKVLADIHQKLQRPDGTLPPVSDLIKTEISADGIPQTYEYVNYVQEGGGVLGVALLGYTYILEKMGIRFYKLAGTSAGAINTMLTAVIDPERYKDIVTKESDEPLLKSEAVLYELINKDLFDLVDGAPFARKVVRKFLQRKRYISGIVNSLILFIKIFLGATAILGILTIINAFVVPAVMWWVIALVLSIAVTLCIAGIIFVYFRSKKYLRLFVRSKYGICCGKNFHDWVSDILRFNGVDTTAQLEQLLKKNQQGVQLRPERAAENNTNDKRPVAGSDIILIASDITNQRKVEFPAMARYYWDDPATANPADFVRASMAIPLFFEPFIRNVTRAPQTEDEKLILQNIPEYTSPSLPKEVRFVDGGILSNFPINVFHNPSIIVARLPTLGVKLEDEEHIVPGEKRSFKESLFTYIGNIFSTIRFYYDSDFLLKNQLYEKTIGHVDVHEFNWLNFFLADEEKVALFTKGVEAAKAFFLGGDIWVDGKLRSFEPFDWEKYKVERTNVVRTERKEIPNTIASDAA